MTCYEITTQAEYDARKDEKGACLHIDKPLESGLQLVVASGSASVRAYDSASVRAYGSASVRAYGSASVEAYDSASVRAYDSASVEAGSAVPVQKYPRHRGKITGGVVIEIPDLDNATPDVWLAFYALKPKAGKVVVFKAVDADLKSGYRMAYPIGETVTAPDWADTRSCGQGLHFGPTPRHARQYMPSATRFLACEVDAAAIIPLGDKVKAASCQVLREVDRDGKPVKAKAAAS